MPSSGTGPVITLSAHVERQLHERSRAARWGLSVEDFTARLRVCVAKQFQGAAAPRHDADAAAQALHVEDIALACACAAGHEHAWEHFIQELRPSLYAAARQMAPMASRELADSMFAELYGLETREGRRRSLLDYYHGRSKLSTWLRSVLAQRHVDRLRSSSRTVSLDDDDSGTYAPPDPTPVAEPRRAQYVEMAQRTLDAALRSLAPRDRLRLRLYYAQGLKLAQIGRLLEEHEATVSRKIDRARTGIRQYVERSLHDDHGLAPAAVQECLRVAAGAPELDISKALVADDG